MSLLRRVRGVLVSSTVWGVAFAVVGALFVAQRAITGTFPPSWVDYWPGVLASYIVRGALFGIVSGAVFALTVMVAERRRSIESLSMRRLALWGFLAATVIPVGLTAAYAIANGIPFNATIIPWATAYGLIGAGFGAATYSLARRGRASNPASDLDGISADDVEALPSSSGHIVSPSEARESKIRR